MTSGGPAKDALSASQNATRRYRQVARAAASERTQQRIVEVFFDLLLAKRLDEITLDAVADGAGTARQTVIRLFGGKEKLITAAIPLSYSRITTTRTLPPDASLTRIVQGVAADYEDTGDMVVRLLSQEEQYPELTPMLNTGRAGHRAWAEESFARYLKGLEGSRHDKLIDELVAVTDVYVWKLFRRDLGHSRARVTHLIERLVEKVLADRLG